MDKTCVVCGTEKELGKYEDLTVCLDCYTGERLLKFLKERDKDSSGDSKIE